MSIRHRWYDVLDFGWRHRWKLRVIGAGLVVSSLFGLAGTCAGTPDDGSGYLEIADAGSPYLPVTVASVPTTVSSAVVGTVAEPAVRSTVQVQIGPPPTPPPTTTTTVPQPVDGDCESWAPLLARYGIPFDEARPFMWRESRCSHAYNGTSSTGDESWGVLQVNRYGSLAAWWDEGGYTAEVMSTVEGAVAAAGVLYGSCGWGPWTKPYSCHGDYLSTPEPRWGEW